MTSSTNTPVDFGAMLSGTLVRYDHTPGISTPFDYYNFPEKDLAESYTTSADGLTWTFKIRQDVFWHNRAPANGRRVTAKDVQFNFERYLAKASQQSTVLGNIDKVAAPDDNTFQITFKTNHPDNTDAIFWEYNVLHNPEYITARGGKLGNISADFVGFGPYMITKLVGEERYEYDFNPKYHLKGTGGVQLPYIEHRVIINNMGDSAAQQAAFRSGQIDVVGSLQFALLASLRSAIPGMTIVSDPSSAAGQAHISMQLQGNPVLQDVRIRRAISLAVDRTDLIEFIYDGLGYQAAGLPPSAVGRSNFFTATEMGKYFKPDPAAVKDLLTQAGYPNGIDLPGKIITRETGPIWTNMLQRIQQQLKTNKINVEIQVMPAAEYSNLFFQGKLPFMGQSHIGSPGPSPQSWALMIRSDSPNNYWHVNDPALDALIDKAGATVDQKARQALYQQILTIDNDMQYRTWLVAGSGIAAYQPWVKNMSGNSTGWLHYRHHGKAHVYVEAH